MTSLVVDVKSPLRRRPSAVLASRPQLRIRGRWQHTRRQRALVALQTLLRFLKAPKHACIDALHGSGGRIEVIGAPHTTEVFPLIRTARLNTTFTFKGTYQNHLSESKKQQECCSSHFNLCVFAQKCLYIAPSPKVGYSGSKAHEAHL